MSTDKHKPAVQGDGYIVIDFYAERPFADPNRLPQYTLRHIYLKPGTKFPGSLAPPPVFVRHNWRTEEGTCTIQGLQTDDPLTSRDKDLLLEIGLAVLVAPSMYFEVDFYALKDYLMRQCRVSERRLPRLAWQIILRYVRQNEGYSKSSTAIKTKRKAAPPKKRFQPWRNAPEGTGFILFQNTNARIYFCLNGKHEDLGLGSNSHTLSLIKAFAGGCLRSSEIERLLNPNSKATNLIRRANGALNTRIAQKGFVGVPENTEFIGYTNGAYASCFPIVHADCLQNLEMAYHELEQRIIQDKSRKDIVQDYLNKDKDFTE